MAISAQLQNNHYLLDEYKIYRGVDIADTSKDQQYSLLLIAIEKYLQDLFGIYLLQTQQITKKFSVKNNKVILPSYQINLISAKLDNNNLDLSELYVEGNILKSYNNILTNGINNLELTYTIGYSTIDDIPFNLKLAVFMLADRIFKKSEYGENISSFSNPVGGREVLTQNLSKEFYMLIAPYRVINIG